jgi:GTPase SAR1 family protein
MVEKKIISKNVMLGDMNVGKTTLVYAFMGIQGPVKASVG